MKCITLLNSVLLMVLLTGCATVSDFTLPASQNETYDYASFSVKSPADPAWRLTYSDKEGGSLAFLHADYGAGLFFWATPVLKSNLDEETETDIIDYFQQELLKETKLQPDILLSDQAIQRNERGINDRVYKVLDIDFKIKDDPFETIFYYHLSKDEKLIYNTVLWIDKSKKNPADFKSDLIEKSEKILADMEFRIPKEEELVRMRAQYAITHFLSSLDDKYLAEKIESIRRKYTTAEAETKRWIKAQARNYWGHNNLGILKTYNEKFEKFGDGFDFKGAEKDFRQSITIRPYYETPYFNLAKMYKAHGEADKSIEAYENAITISPNDENLYYELGQLYEEQGNRDKAIANYQGAIRHWGSGFKTLDELKLRLKNLDSAK